MRKRRGVADVSDGDRGDGRLADPSTARRSSSHFTRCDSTRRRGRRGGDEQAATAPRVSANTRLTRAAAATVRQRALHAAAALRAATAAHSTATRSRKRACVRASAQVLRLSPLRRRADTSGAAVAAALQCRRHKDGARRCVKNGSALFSPSHGALQTVR